MRTPLLALVMLVIAATSAAQEEARRINPRVDFADRLESLSPDEPEAYFLLAEDIASVAAGTADVSLAKRLYVLALVLASEDPPNDSGYRVAASACLGLASLESIESRQTWLRALAGLLDERYAARRWDTSQDAEAASQQAFRLAEAVGLTLSGDGSLARQRFDDPLVEAMLESTRDALDRPGSQASTSAIRRQAEIWPCPECSNARTVPDRAEGGRARRLCSTCRGNPGPDIDHETFVAYLAYQAALLRGAPNSWAAELAMGRDKPLLDPDVDAVAPLYGIDPSYVRYRDGRWVPDDEALESDRQRP